MKIKKIGHCCLVVDINGKRVMTDPGSFTVPGQELEKNIDLIVITHEHQDHLHVESLKNILVNNPNVIVVTNSSVGKILNEAGIKFEKLEDGQDGEFAGVFLEAQGDKHAFIRSGLALVQNTGYFIGGSLFYPGDSFTVPNKPVDILALPVAAPWLKVGEVFEYAKVVKPKIAFPVHDGMLNNFGLEYVGRVIPGVLLSLGIEFKILGLGVEEEF